MVYEKEEIEEFGYFKHAQNSMLERHSIRSDPA
jgi:hypothetical protein